MPEDALEVPLDHGAGRGHFRNAARLRHPEPVPQGAHRVEGRPGRPVDAPQLLLERVGVRELLAGRPQRLERLEALRELCYPPRIRFG